MNRFRTRKKHREEAPPSQPLAEQDSPAPFWMFGKKKSHEEEPKKDIDLSSALPSCDDLRTSLLMTGLSARFSMLREQDDPNSKLGKASDDSVLPKSQSRLALGLDVNPLHDIAETESIRPPPLVRFDSYHSCDDAASITGSIMSRAKPTEGNVLFGGRQKLFKIAAGTNPKTGGMSGRTLYVNDVSQSAFEKWRQAEREASLLRGVDAMDVVDHDSPPSDYSRRRETNSTTSSGPSAARDSTPATSTTSSQPAHFPQDFPPTGPVSSPTCQPATLDRSGTRARRLYEQGLTQDLQEQQTSALTRMDTLSRQRPFDSRTAEPSPPIPSIVASFGDRGPEIRSAMGKVGLPNPRSFSPPTLGSAQGSPADFGTNFARQERRPTYGTSPPLSPPISEAEDTPALPIRSSDRGKATAMGVFQRPVQQYDESKYAQRQRQLQQARENTAGRGPLDSSVVSFTTAAELKAQGARPNGQTSLNAYPDLPPNMTATATKSVASGRPHDDEHPAFRASAFADTPSIYSIKPSDKAEPANEEGFLTVDSPTLGPASGLSGMIRQHLRDGSGSSITGGVADQEGAESSPCGRGDSLHPGDLNLKPNLVADGGSSASEYAESREGTGQEPDEFARHLADGARRVRARLTSYVESDNERSTTPTALACEAGREVSASRTANALGILRSQSSRGSLWEHSRENRERSRSRSAKTREPGTQDVPELPRDNKLSAAVSEGMRKEVSHVGSSTCRDGSLLPAGETDESTHIGAKVFRQMRWDLHKTKEAAAQLRQQAPSPQTVAGTSDPMAGHRVTSATGGPPLAMFNRRPQEDSRSRSRSRAGSRPAADRDRSCSDASTGGRAQSRGPRPRIGSSPYEEHQDGSVGSTGFANRSGLGSKAAHTPGQDVRRSPMVPCQQSPVMRGPGKSPPSTTVGACSTPPSNRRGGSGMAPDGSGRVARDASMVMEPNGQPETPSRQGNLPSAASSTPNLHHVSMVAPPVPPINPRRKMANGNQEANNGCPGWRSGSVDDKEGAMVAPGVAEARAGAEEAYRSGIMRRMTNDSNGRARQSPMRGTVRPPVPYTCVSNGSIPGGMI